jgi:DNA-binding response OmpR family regulator
MQARNILLLEDDANLGFVIRDHLEAHGFTVLLKTNGVDGLAETRKRRFDILLVDVMMPKKDGFTFTREFRAADTQTPIIFLTAKALKEDRVEGFRIGGDDYVTKPFSIDELLLRIKAILRRTSGAGQGGGSGQGGRGGQTGPHAGGGVGGAATGGAATGGPTDGIIKIGALTFDSNRQILAGRKTERNLTSRESQLLEMLASRMNRDVDRSEILATIWGEDNVFNSRSLDVFVSKLRKHLAADPAIEIKSVHGKGFRLITS